MWRTAMIACFGLLSTISYAASVVVDGIAVKGLTPVVCKPMVTIKSLSFSRAVAVESKAQVLVVTGTLVSNINETITPMSVVLRFDFGILRGGLTQSGTATTTIDKPACGVDTHFSCLTDWPITQGDAPLAYRLSVEVKPYQPPKLGK